LAPVVAVMPGFSASNSGSSVMLTGLWDSAGSSCFMNGSEGYDSVSSLASSRGVSFRVVYGWPLEPSMAYEMAKPVAATGAFTTGFPYPPGWAKLVKAASALPVATRFRASGSPVWTCTKENFDALLRQKFGAHCPVAWIINSEP
jgi:hypothetical protein